ncbi:hypothetical protein ACHAPO_009184 [Fusarium lateritium]
MLPLPTTTDDAPYWIQGREFHTEQYPGDPRRGREVVAQVQELIPLRHGHRPFCWGFAILRTAFGPRYDALFNKFVITLHRIVRLQTSKEAEVLRRFVQRHKRDRANHEHVSDYVDTRPNDELCRSFKIDILDDRQRLENAPVTLVRTTFRRWIKDMKGTSLAGDMRFAACIMADAETLHQFMDAHADFPRTSEEGFLSSYWLKLVDAETMDQFTTRPDGWQQAVSEQRMQHWQELFDTGIGPNDTVRVRLYGKEDYRKYWFDRNRRRLHLSEMTHRYDDDNPGLLYYGCVEPRTRPKISIYSR